MDKRCDIYKVDEYNLVELLGDEIYTYGKNWTSKEKADYIYIRMCQLFNYDERYLYSNSDKLQEEIFDNIIDVNRVNTSKTVCNGFSNAFCDSLDILLKGNRDFYATTPVAINGHVSSTALFRNLQCEYDPILYANDFMSSKVALPLNGISINNLNEWEEENYQKESLNNIGYKTEGEDTFKTIRSNASKNSKNYDEYFDYLINNIDFKNLGLYEVKNILNLQTIKTYGYNLSKLGIKFDFEEKDNSKMIFKYINSNKDEYLTEEENGKVKVYRR